VTEPTAPARKAPAMVRARMYDVGFGDCFLVTFPARDRERVVLIDCGVHSASKGKHKIEEVIRDVIETVTGVSGRPRIDVVVATHRHRDHVHGFRDDEVWSKVEVGEVWMPWTEDPTDAEARRIKDRQSKRARLLYQLALNRADAAWGPVQAIVENNYTNGEAMATLHRGFDGAPRRYFLPEADGGARSASFEPEILPGVTVHVLGPMRNEDAIRDMEPPEDDAYLNLGSGMGLASDGRNLPFEAWIQEQTEYIATWKHLDIQRSELGRIVTSGRIDALSLAVGLEKAVNGTSLMLLFECGDARLLFPGDAQWGTWDRVIADPRKRELIGSANLYKVGHHGSHNATPRRYVELVAKRVEQLNLRPDAALVSVAPTGIPSWSQIPRGPLLEALRPTWTHVLRSDEPVELSAPGDGPATATGGNVQVGPDGLWMEVGLPVRRS